MHNKKASQATGYGFVGRQQVILDSDKIGHRVITSYYIYIVVWLFPRAILVAPAFMIPH